MKVGFFFVFDLLICFPVFTLGVPSYARRGRITVNKEKRRGILMVKSGIEKMKIHKK